MRFSNLHQLEDEEISSLISMRISGIAGMRRCGIAKNEEMRYCQSEADGKTNVIE